MVYQIKSLIKVLLILGPRYHGGSRKRQALFLGSAFILLATTLHLVPVESSLDGAATDPKIIEVFLFFMALPLLFLAYAHERFPSAAREVILLAQALLESLAEAL
jgi:hypothetical protein